MNETVLVALVVAVAVAVVLALWQARGRTDPAALRSLETVSELVGQLRSELAQIARAQAEIRQDVQRGREASLSGIADAAQGLRAEIGAAHRMLTEVRALEQGRARQMDQAADSLRRLEAVVAGSASRGAAGENILARALAQLPPDLLATNVAFKGKVVEYVLRLPGGRVLPIDSKWTSLAPLEKLDAAGPEERRKLEEQIAREVRGRTKEMAKYVDAERTVGLGLVAVPDAVYASSSLAAIEGYRDGVLVVPYSLALPYVLALYRLTLRFGCSLDTERLTERLHSIEESLRQIDEEVEGRLSRALVLAANSRDALQEHVATAQRACARLMTEGTPAESVEQLPLPDVEREGESAIAVGASSARRSSIDPVDV